MNISSNLDGGQVTKWILHPPLTCLVAFSRGGILKYRDLGTATAERLPCFCLYGLKEVASQDRCAWKEYM